MLALLNRDRGEARQRLVGVVAEVGGVTEHVDRLVVGQGQLRADDCAALVVVLGVEGGQHTGGLDAGRPDDRAAWNRHVTYIDRVLADIIDRRVEDELDAQLCAGPASALLA